MKGKVRFPKNFHKDAKSIVKHLLVADLAKRYGNLKRGVKDIKYHRWFKTFDWKKCVSLKLNPPYIPPVRSSGDTSMYSEYPDSPELPRAIKHD